MTINNLTGLKVTNARLRFIAILSLVFSGAMTQAHAELVISEPSQKINSVGQNNGSQIYAKQAINNQVPSDGSIIKLMQVMHIDEQIATIINSQQLAIDVINNQTNKANQPSAGDKINKRQRELQTKIQQILGQYTQIIGEGINEATDVETMTKAYMSAAKAYYTQAEVDAQIEFYDTTIGQSILAKQPQVSAAFLQQSLPKDMDLENTKEQLNQMLPQLKQLFKDAL